MAVKAGIALFTAIEATGAVIGTAGGMAAAEALLPFAVPLGALAGLAIVLALAAYGIDDAKRGVIEGQAQKLTALSARVELYPVAPRQRPSRCEKVVVG